MRVRVRLAVLGLAGILALSGCGSNTTGSAVALPGFGVSSQSAAGATAPAAPGGSSGSGDNGGSGTGSAGSAESGGGSSDESGGGSSDGSAGSSDGSGGGSSDGSGGGSSDGAGGLGSFNSACLGVASAYASIMLALLPALTGGQGGTYDADQIAKAVGGLSGDIPDELKADFAVVSAAAAKATGKSLAEAGQILDDPTVKKATDDIDAWMTKNCGG